MKKLILVLSLLMLFMDSSYGFAGVMYKMAVKETAKKSPGIIVMLKSFGQKVLKQAPKAGGPVIKAAEGSGKFIVETAIKHPVKTVVLMGGTGTAVNYNVNEKFREDMNKFGTEVVSTAFGKVVTEPVKDGISEAFKWYTAPGLTIIFCGIIYTLAKIFKMFLKAGVFKRFYRRKKKLLVGA